MLFDGKLFLSKTNWSIQNIFENRDKIVYIVHGRRLSKFARCAIALLFELNGNPYLRFISGGDSRQRSEFTDFGALVAWATLFLLNFMTLTHHGCTMANHVGVQPFPSAYGSS